MKFHEIRMNGSGGEVKQMPDNKDRDHRPAEHHRAGSCCGLHVTRLLVGDRASCSLYDSQLYRSPGMKKNGHQQHSARPPEQFRIAMESFRVVVHDFAAKEDLKIPQHVQDQESEQYYSRDRHDGLLADRGIVEPRNRNRTHKLPLSPLCKRNIVSKNCAAQRGLMIEEPL